MRFGKKEARKTDLAPVDATTERRFFIFALLSVFANRQNAKDVLIMTSAETNDEPSGESAEADDEIQADPEPVDEDWPSSNPLDYDWPKSDPIDDDWPGYDADGGGHSVGDS